MVNFAKLADIFLGEPSVKLAYFFGSRATNNFGPSSDYDFAIYLMPYDPETALKIKIKLLSKLTSLLKTDEVDLLILNNSDRPELNFEIIKDGKVLMEKEPARILIEPKIMNDYFDYNFSFSKYGLVKNK